MKRVITGGLLSMALTLALTQGAMALSPAMSMDDLTNPEDRPVLNSAPALGNTDVLGNTPMGIKWHDYETEALILTQQADHAVSAANNPRIKDYLAASDWYMKAAYQYELARVMFHYAPKENPQQAQWLTQKENELELTIKKLRFKSYQTRMVAGYRTARGLL